MKGDEERNEADARCEAARGVWFEGRESRRTYLIKTLVYIGSTLLLLFGALLIGGKNDSGRVYLGTHLNDETVHCVDGKVGFAVNFPVILIF